MGCGQCTYVVVILLLGLALAAAVVAGCIDYWYVKGDHNRIGLWRVCVGIGGNLLGVEIAYKDCTSRKDSLLQFKKGKLLIYSIVMYF